MPSPAWRTGIAGFIRDLAEAATFTHNRLAETFSALMREFTSSIEFEEHLAASTQVEYRRMLTAAESDFADMPLAALDDPRVRRDFLDWREKIAKSSGQREADNRLSAISAMLSWAVDRGRLAANHVRGFKRLYHSDRAEIIWLPEHVTEFMGVAPVELQRALIIASHTGQRQGDILRMPWSAFDGTVIRLRPSKNTRKRIRGRPITIKCTKALRRLLSRMRRTSPLILTTKTGQAFKKRYFAELWECATAEAGLDQVMLPDHGAPVALHLHDLRGTAVTMLSEAGCSRRRSQRSPDTASSACMTSWTSTSRVSLDDIHLDV